jgi:hypothetical protein
VTQASAARAAACVPKSASREPHPAPPAGARSVRSELLKNLWGGADPLSGFPMALYAGDIQGRNSDHPYMRETVRLCRPRVIVEVGVWKGGSVIEMAKEVKAIGLDSAIIAVDTWLGAWDHWLNDRWKDDLCFKYGYLSLYYTFVKNLHDSRTVEIVVPLPLDSANAFRTLQWRQFIPDMVHIDGAHDYDSVTRDLQN